MLHIASDTNVSGAATRKTRLTRTVQGSNPSSVSQRHAIATVITPNANVSRRGRWRPPTPRPYAHTTSDAAGNS